MKPLYPGTELDALARAENYYHWMLYQFAPYIGKRVVEIGAGIGTFSAFLLDRYADLKLVAVEPAVNLLPRLQQRFAGDARVLVVHGYAQDLDGTTSANTVFLVNVLEHIREEQETLDAAYRILDAGGNLLLVVPAMPALYGTLDVAFEHQRRYTKPQLRKALEKAGFHLEFIRYFNLLGVFAWFLAGRVLRRKTIRAGEARLYSRWVIPWASRLEHSWEPPIGQSLIAVARK